jgi:DNA-cytosine methyltransferase
VGVEIMKILSLFDGISCARVALEREGIPVEAYYASEVDKYAIQISQKNYPDTVQLGDVKELCSEEGLRKWLPDIDLMIGGSPCQDLSIAKKDRKGLSGERSGLFWNYVLILKYVKPKYFILENVNSMPKEAKEIITKELGVEPIMINAALVSAQNRKRLFWTNIPSITQPEDRGILLRDILQENVDEKYNLNVDRTKYVLNRPKNFAVKIDPDKTNTLRTNYGNASANETYVTTKRIGQLNKGGQGDRIYSPEGKSVGLSALGGGRGAKTGLYAVALRNRGQGKKPEIGGDKANAMTTVQTDSMVIENTQIRKLTPIECERLQGLPDNYTEGISNSQRYKTLGNAFNVDVVAHILSFIKP